MPICIECRYPVPRLYHVLHSGKNGFQKPPPINRSTKPTPPNSAKKGDIPARTKAKPAPAVAGGDVRLTQCPRCKRFADKYVEHDYVVLFIDLVLVKPQVYRHLLFNRLGRDDDELDPSILRLGILLLLFDVYLTWSRIESLPHMTASSPVPHLPILLQYAFYLLLCAGMTVAQHLTIRWLAHIAGLGARSRYVESEMRYEAPDDAAVRSTPNGISTALFVSSCMKLFPILMVVWRYNDVGGSVGRGVEWAVAVQNLEALRILLECGYLGAASLVGAGWLARWAIGRLTLGFVGLGEWKKQFSRRGRKTMAQHGGAADSYYNYGGQQQYQQQPNSIGNQQPQYPPGPDLKFQQPPPNYGQNNQNTAPPLPQTAGDGKQTFENAFKLEKPKYNDLWAGILLILTFLGFTAVSGLSLQGYASNKSFNGGGIYNAPNDFSLNTNSIVLFAFILLVAFVFSWAYFTAARAFTKQFIWITGILHIAFGIGTCIYYFYRGYYSAAIVFALFSIFSIICFISWIPRIPFSVVMLQQTMDVAKSFGHVFLVSAIGGIVSVAFGAWFSVTLVAIYVKYEPSSGGTNPACSSGSGGSCSSAKVIGLIFFVTFAAYWITEWLKNTIHSVIAGVYGSWFFCAGKPGGMPSGATRGAFRRSMTYSFGSISFGSLVVAIINMLRQAVSIAQHREAAEGNIVASIAFCCLGCLISLLRWVVQFINRYAFSHIALYGKAYIPAAKDTWTMMKNRGIDALINDCLIGPVLTMGSVFVAYLCTLLAYLYLQFTEPAYNEGGKFTPVVMAFAFLIGLQVCQIFMTPIGSGVDTIFVASAWDPEVLMRDHADLYQRMVKVYPKVQTAIHA
ncbi:MAG: hypothetical protein Q9215_002091 [Flavoplaca cf. flavocitrina]